MHAKLSAELVQRLLDAESAESSREIPIIVTATSHERLTALAKAGFTPERVFEHIPAAAGRATTHLVRALATIDGIESIDYDGQVQAL